MSKRSKGVHVNKQKRETVEEGAAQTGAVRPKIEARAWTTLSKLPSGSNRTDARRKVPHGPLGGSGRKTNLSRSS